MITSTTTSLRYPTPNANSEQIAKSFSGTCRIGKFYSIASFNRWENAKRFIRTLNEIGIYEVSEVPRSIGRMASELRWEVFYRVKGYSSLKKDGRKVEFPR